MIFDIKNIFIQSGNKKTDNGLIGNYNLFDFLIRVTGLTVAVFLIIKFSHNNFHHPFFSVISLSAYLFLFFVIYHFRHKLSVLLQKNSYFTITYLLSLGLMLSEFQERHGYYIAIITLLLSYVLFPRYYNWHFALNLFVVCGFNYLHLNEFSEQGFSINALFDILFLNYLFIGAFLLFLNQNTLSNPEHKKQHTVREEELEKKVSDLKEKNKKLKKDNDTQETLLAMIAHDMKSPLSSLMGMVTLIRQSLDQGLDLHQIVSQLDNKIRNTSLNIDNVLEWSKAHHKGLSLSPVNFNLKNALEQAVNFVMDSFSAKNIRVTINYEAHPIAYGDENAFQVAVRNLISNALKFSYKGGSVEINVLNKEKDSTEIQIIDHGTGIPEKKLNRLFDIKNSTPGTNGEKGSGLGLLITQKFVLANNGKLQMHSNEGEGSVFSFTIPSFVKKQSAPSGKIVDEASHQPH